MNNEFAGNDFFIEKIIDGAFFVIANQSDNVFDRLTDGLTSLSENLHKYGAIILKGFNIDNAVKFKKIAGFFANDLMSDNGEHNPIHTVGGVYTPVAYSKKEKLLWHNENSFNKTWPLMIMFAAVMPSKVGGETPIADCRKVLNALAPEVVEEFTRKGVMYVRSHGFGLGRTWQETYCTQSKNELINKLSNEGITVEWFGDDQFITRQIRPAIIKHPITHEKAWFTQAQHWHPYCLNPVVREALLKIFPENQLPRNCYFGDGTRIADSMMQHILDVYQSQEIVFPWEQGDVMILDNVLYAHARNPYEGERQLLVTMGKHTEFCKQI